jgi:hypothetical protein
MQRFQLERFAGMRPFTCWNSSGWLPRENVLQEGGSALRCGEGRYIYRHVTNGGTHARIRQRELMLLSLNRVKYYSCSTKHPKIVVSLKNSRWMLCDGAKMRTIFNFLSYCSCGVVSTSTKEKATRTTLCLDMQANANANANTDTKNQI